MWFLHEECFINELFNGRWLNDNDILREFLTLEHSHETAYIFLFYDYLIISAYWLHQMTLVDGYKFLKY